jgi:hypothetical protein
VIVPGVEVPGAAQGLPELRTNGLSHVVDDDDGDIASPLQLAKEAKQGGNILGAVFVEAVQAHERVMHSTAVLSR